MLGELTASIAHEVNQPLGAILTNGEAALLWLDRPQPNLDELRALSTRTIADAQRAADIICRIRDMVTRAETARARTGRILITRPTADRGAVFAEDFGARELKGVSELVTLYRIVRASGGGRRGGARALAPLVGREEELDILSRRWERARKGEGQLALVVGEPGLGKSRLMEESPPVSGRNAAHMGRMVVVATVAKYAAAPDRRMGPPAASAPTCPPNGDSPISRTLCGWSAWTRPGYRAPDRAAAWSVPLPDDRQGEIAPEELRRRRLAAMTAWVLAGARSQPVVLAFEDLHWADPTSLEHAADPRRARRAAAAGCDDAAGMPPGLEPALAP